MESAEAIWSDLVEGQSDWINIQQIVRSAFLTLLNEFATSQKEIHSISRRMEQLEASHNQTKEKVEMQAQQTHILAQNFDHISHIPELVHEIEQKCLETTQHLNAVVQAVESKADAVLVENELSKKCDFSDFQKKISLKSDIDLVNECLEKKANKNSVIAALQKKANAEDVLALNSKIEKLIINFPGGDLDSTARVQRRVDMVVKDVEGEREEMRRSLEDLNQQLASLRAEFSRQQMSQSNGGGGRSGVRWRDTTTPSDQPTGRSSFIGGDKSGAEISLGRSGVGVVNSAVEQEEREMLRKRVEECVAQITALRSEISQLSQRPTHLATYEQINGVSSGVSGGGGMISDKTPLRDRMSSGGQRVEILENSVSLSDFQRQRKVVQGLAKQADECTHGLSALTRKMNSMETQIHKCVAFETLFLSSEKKLHTAVEKQMASVRNELMETRDVERQMFSELCENAKTQVFAELLPRFATFHEQLSLFESALQQIVDKVAMQDRENATHLSIWKDQIINETKHLIDDIFAVSQNDVTQLHKMVHTQREDLITILKEKADAKLVAEKLKEKCDVRDVTDWAEGMTRDVRRGIAQLQEQVDTKITSLDAEVLLEKRLTSMRGSVDTLQKGVRSMLLRER